MKFSFKKPPSNAKIITVSFLAVLWVFFMAMFIYTSWYQNDLLITKAIGDVGFYDPIINPLAGYIVQDGYFSLTTMIIPMLVLIIESLAAYAKKYYPMRKITQYLMRTKGSWAIFLGCVWSLIAAILSFFLIFQDRGFGYGFQPEYFQDWSFAVVSFIGIYFFSNAIAWGLIWYITHRLAVRPDFLEAGYWKRAIFFAFFIIWMYLPIMLLKLGFQRPLYLQIHWKDYLDYLETYNHDRWLHYMNQNTIHYGYHVPGSHLEGYVNDAVQNLPGEWPWYRPAQMGLFFNGTPLEGDFFPDAAFPSGHLATSVDLIAGVCVFVFPTKSDWSKQHARFAQGAGLTISIGYTAWMFFALGLDYGHWMNDMAFTFMYAPLAILIARLMSNAIINAFTKHVKKLTAKEALTPQPLKK